MTGALPRPKGITLSRCFPSLISILHLHLHLRLQPCNALTSNMLTVFSWLMIWTPTSHHKRVGKVLHVLVRKPPQKMSLCFVLSHCFLGLFSCPLLLLCFFHESVDFLKSKGLACVHPFQHVVVFCMVLSLYGIVFCGMHFGLRAIRWSFTLISMSIVLLLILYEISTLRTPSEKWMCWVACLLCAVL